MINNTDKLQQPQDNWICWEKIGLFLIIAAAVVARAVVNFSTDLMPGLMSAYYPIQVRALLENGQLGFPDFPLVFYLEAGLAKILQILGFCDLNNCVMFSSKFIDAALYPLIAIPIFLLAKNILANAKVPRWVPLLAAALVAISGPSFVMMADFQKNSIGLMWSAFYIYFLYLLVNHGKIRNYLLAGTFFGLTGLTHIGDLGFIIAFTLCYFLFTFIFERQKRSFVLKILGLLITLAVLVSLILFFSDPARLNRLKDVFLYPLTMFQNPMITSILQGRVPVMTTLLDLTLPNILAIYAIILFIIKRKEMDSQNKILFLSTLLITIFLASPFLKEELGNRLYKMAYLPIIIVIVICLKYIFVRYRQILFALIVFVLMVGSAPIVATVRGATNISNEAYHDLSKLKTAVTIPDKTLIITRHGLEFWTAWVLQVEVTSTPNITSDDAKNYEAVYYLRQKSGQGNFGPFGPSGILFPEVEIPEKSQIVYEDEFYILAKALPGFLQNNYKNNQYPRKE